MIMTYDAELVASIDTEAETEKTEGTNEVWGAAKHWITKMWIVPLICFSLAITPMSVQAETRAECIAGYAAILSAAIAAATLALSRGLFSCILAAEGYPACAGVVIAIYLASVAAATVAYYVAIRHCPKE